MADQLSPIRNRIPEIITGVGFGLFPASKKNFPYGKLSQAQSDALEKATGRKPKTEGVTNCGAFPGWIVQRLGGRGIEEVLKFQFKKGIDTYAPTAPMTAWDEWAAEYDKKTGRTAGNTVWIPFRGPERPKPGDIYVLQKVRKAAEIKVVDGAPEPGGKAIESEGFAHVGFIINSAGSSWRTADSGQDSGYDACYQNRTFNEASRTLYLDPAAGSSRLPPDKGLRILKGWVDVDKLFAGWSM